MKIASNTHKHRQSRAYQHSLAHTHTWGDSRSLFLQSNFGGDEMGDELRREGCGMKSALNYKIQKQIALLSICKDISTHTHTASLSHTHAHTQTRSCNLQSHSDILLLFHSISPVLRQTAVFGLVAKLQHVRPRAQCPLTLWAAKYKPKNQGGICQITVFLQNVMIKKIPQW